MRREFVYAGEPILELNEQEHMDFLVDLQKSVIISLEDRQVLTGLQREYCLAELDRQRNQRQLKQSQQLQQSQQQIQRLQKNERKAFDVN